MPSLTDRHRPSRTFKLAGLALGLAAGVWLVTRFVNAGGNILTEAQKITQVMSLIQQAYVEQPDMEKLSEGAIEGMLKRLDPHSVYIPPAEQKEIAERDQGEFEGIGISFVIQNELITVISAIPGTPADRLGIRSGDRIVEIDGISAYGITSDEVFKKLRGKRGTTVKVKVAREGAPELIDYTIIRDAIPIHSVWASFMLDDSTGYILLNQFMATTSGEFDAALRQMESRGMTRLVFDLRNNQGGRLNEAVEVADMLIPGRHPIVSRRGRIPGEDSTYYSTDRATHPQFDLVILVSGGTASASEIVSGAVQDLDRGLIIGQQTFGKGLVQFPYALKGGGVIRLSTAHYYTPSGRLIQRPYDKGRGEYYAVRMRGGDDTTKHMAFKTLGGRTVYDATGITPDSTVEDHKITGAAAQLIGAQVMFPYAQSLVKVKGLTPDYGFDRYLLEFSITDADLKQLIEVAKEKKVNYPEDLLSKDRDYLATLLKAEIAQIVWNSRDYYYRVMAESDPVVKTARSLFGKARDVAAVWRRASKS
ncbi:MAG: S41 family peptidase [Calditrichaeota bacterium]|nr:S41 family peptidase [Calditrichota bacterium]